MVTLIGIIFLVVGLYVMIWWPSQRGEVKRLQHLPDRGVEEEVLIAGTIDARSPTSYRDFVICRPPPGCSVSIGPFPIRTSQTPPEIRPPFLLRSDGRDIRVRGRSVEEAFKMRGAAPPSILQRLIHAEGVRALKGMLQTAGQGFENYRVEWGRLSSDAVMGLKAGDTVTVHGLGVSDEEIAATTVFAGDREAYLAYSRRVFWLQPLAGVLCIVSGLLALSAEILGDISAAFIGAFIILFALIMIGAAIPLRRGRLTPLPPADLTWGLAASFIFGTLTLVAGLGLSLLVVMDTRSQPQRLQSLPVLTRFSELQAYQGRRVFLEGPIAPGSAPTYKGFVVYQLYEAEELQDDELRWQLRETHTPAFELELGDGRVLVTGNYGGYKVGPKVKTTKWAK